MPWLLLMALKQQGFAGVEIGIATENGRELSADLKAEPEVLAFFGTDLDSIRPVAEMLGLLQPRLNLASAMSDTDDLLVLSTIRSPSTFLFNPKGANQPLRGRYASFLRRYLCLTLHKLSWTRWSW